MQFSFEYFKSTINGPKYQKLPPSQLKTILPTPMSIVHYTEKYYRVGIGKRSKKGYSLSSGSASAV